jgi:hypothetical protein
MLQIAFYAPDSAVEKVKEAMFAAGAGRVGNYDRCAWQTIGQGQFRPLPGSNPAIGAQNTLEVLDEWKVEMVCEEDCLDRVLAALKATHPYETPAYQVTRAAT